jgi:hypothetical protein
LQQCCNKTIDSQLQFKFKKTMNKFGLLICVGMVSALSFSSCKDDEPEDPIIPNEEEVITTLNYTLTPQDGGAAIVLSFQDLDGDGGDDPVISSGILAANSSYTGKLELLNETEDPAEDITEEVAEENEEHQFFFSSSISDLSVSYSDSDPNGNPVGIETLLNTGDVGSGTITVILRHEPSKSASGVNDGDITNAGGETDIEVTFDVDVQ